MLVSMNCASIHCARQCSQAPPSSAASSVQYWDACSLLLLRLCLAFPLSMWVKCVSVLFHSDFFFFCIYFCWPICWKLSLELVPRIALFWAIKPLLFCALIRNSSSNLINSIVLGSIVSSLVDESPVLCNFLCSRWECMKVRGLLGILNTSISLQKAETFFGPWRKNSRVPFICHPASVRQEIPCPNYIVHCYKPCSQPSEHVSLETFHMEMCNVIISKRQRSCHIGSRELQLSGSLHNGILGTFVQKWREVKYNRWKYSHLTLQLIAFLLVFFFYSRLDPNTFNNCIVMPRVLMLKAFQRLWCYLCSVLCSYPPCDVPWGKVAVVWVLRCWATHIPFL